MEQQMLLFFNTVTAPTLSGDFSSDFWERRVIQASAVEPTSEHHIFIQNLLVEFSPTISGGDNLKQTHPSVPFSRCPHTDVTL